MRKIQIIFIILLLSSCKSLITNQGFKEYDSEIQKNDNYKKLNKYQQDLLYLDDLCAHAVPYIDSIFPENKREFVVDSLLNLLSDKQSFNIYARYYLSHFKNQHIRIKGLKSNMISPYKLHSVNNKWYLWDINNEYDSTLIESQVIKINNIPINNITKILENYVFAENPISTTKSIEKFINRPDILHKLGIIAQTDSVLLSLKNGKKCWIKTITNDNKLNWILGNKRYKPNQITKHSNDFYKHELYPNRNFAYFQFNKCHDKIDAFDTMSAYLKPWTIPFAKLS